MLALNLDDDLCEQFHVDSPLQHGVIILNIVDCENFREISLTSLQIVVSGNQTN